MQRSKLEAGAGTGIKITNLWLLVALLESVGVPVGGLLALAIGVGIFPRPLLDLIEPAAATVASLVAR